MSGRVLAATAHGALPEASTCVSELRLPECRDAGVLYARLCTALDPRKFLRTLTSSRSTRDDKTQLLEAVRQLRVQGDAVYFAFLDALLAEVDSVRGNVWAMRRWPVALPSYRVKLGCLSRLLDELAKEGVDENVRRDSPVPVVAVPQVPRGVVNLVAASRGQLVGRLQLAPEFHVVVHRLHEAVPAPQRDLARE